MLFPAGVCGKVIGGFVKFMRGLRKNRRGLEESFEAYLKYFTKPPNFYHIAVNKSVDKLLTNK